MALQELLGLEISNYAVKIAYLTGKPNKISLKVLDQEILPRTGDYALAVDGAIERLYSRNMISNTRVAISVPASVTSIKKIQIPKVAPELIPEAISWEADQYLPVDLNEFRLDFQVLPGSKDATTHQILLVAVPKAAVENAAQLVAKAGLTPLVVDVPAFALENQYLINYPHEKSLNVCLVDIGASSTLINVLSNQSTVFTHTLSLGGDNYTQFIQDKLSVDVLEAENIKLRSEALSKELLEQLDEISLKLAQEIKKILASSEQAFDVKAEKILLSGGGSLLTGLKDYLATTLGKPVEFLNCLNNVKFNKAAYPAEVLESYKVSMATVIGLGMRRW